MLLPLTSFMIQATDPLFTQYRYWLVGYPADVVKNRMMGDSFRNPKYPTMRLAFSSVWNHHGPEASVARRIATMYTGIVPCLARAFPTNAAALFAFETTMRLLGAEKVSRSAMRRVSDGSY